LYALAGQYHGVLAFHAAVREDVVKMQALLGKHLADEQPSVAVCGARLTAEQRDPVIGGATRNTIQGVPKLGLV
jgi:hypothetical protein